RELDALLGARERALALGTPGFARIHGPAGIGRSHLLRAFARHLAAHGAAVVEAGADRRRGGALGLIAQVARALLAIAADARSTPAELAAIPARLAPILGPGAALPKGGRPRDLRLDVADALGCL